MMIEKYKHPILFYCLATMIPWALWFAAGYISHITPYSDQYLEMASVVAFIGLLGPVAVAYWLIRQDPALRADLYSRFFNFSSVKPIYILLACFLMPASILLAQAISLLFGHSASQFVITGHFTFSSGIFPVWFMLIIAPMLEELGWHSYGTDCLRNRMNLFKTSLLFALFWGIWHMPLAGIRDYYQSNLVETSWIYGVNFLVSMFPFVLLMNWLYYKTGRNIVITVVFHITAGFFNEIFATHPDSKIIQTVLLMVLAVGLVVSDRGVFFERVVEGAVR
ncbi:MAG: CPBP family intramembrane metalloprotease [Gammaproteobacteria bacterium]|nr:CPBP family intramembrane metalloprotease [Gammaproteobacteria bacterium]